MAKTRTLNEREADLVLIEQWYLREKKTQKQIALELSAMRPYSITQQQVSKDLETLHKRWQAATVMDMDLLKAAEIRRIDKLELEYWDAWERSQRPAETRTQKQKRGKQPARAKEGADETEMTFSSKGQVGDPRFLAGVQWCVEQRCKILGLNAPQEVKWEIELARDVKNGKLSFETVAAAFNDEAYARRLFAEAGIPIQ